MNIDIIKKLTVCVLCVVLILCFVSCSQVNNGDTPDIPSETENEEPKETEINEETTAPDTKEWPIVETPAINSNEIVWSKYEMLKSTSVWQPGLFQWSIMLPDDHEFVGEVDDEKWYCVEIVNYNTYLKELVVKSKDNWPEGIDADGKLTALLDDYNAKYGACMEYLKGRTAEEINEALSDDAYLELRESALKAAEDFFKYCNSYFDIDNNKKRENAFWDDIEIENSFAERMKLLGLFEYKFKKDTVYPCFVAKGKDLKALPDRVQAIDGFGVYWSVNHDSGEWN